MNIMVLGNFSGFNAGDNAILESIIMDLKNSLDSYLMYIPTVNSEYINNKIIPKYACDKKYTFVPVNIDKFSLSIRFFGLGTIKAVYKSDLILTTAGTLFDRNILKINYNFIVTFLPLLSIAKIYNKKIVGYNVGLSRPTSILGKYILTKVLNKHNLIVLRDHNTVQILKYLKIKSKIILSSDVVLSNNHQIELSNNYNNNLTVGINITSYIDSIINKQRNIKNSFLSKEEFIDCISNACDELVKTRNATIYLLVTSKSDLLITKKLLKCSSYSHNYKLFDLTELYYEEIINIIKDIDIIVGMRMHAIILATNINKPAISINYDEKVANYMSMIGQSQFSLNFEDISTENLLNIIYEVIDNLYDIKTILLKKINYLRKLNQKSKQEIIELLTR